MMGTNIKFSLLIFILTGILSQTEGQAYLGLNAGYGFINMNDVNDNLDDIHNYLKRSGFQISSPEGLNGGLFAEGSFNFRIDQFLIGTTVSTLSGSGKIDYYDPGLKYKEQYDASTVEILWMAGAIFPLTEITALTFKGFAGLGIAKIQYDGSITNVVSPQNNETITQTAKGIYFAGRLQGGVDLNVAPVVISLGLAYRMANSGELKGNLTYNGEVWADREMYDINGNDMEIDYSGVTFLAGVQLIL